MFLRNVAMCCDTGGKCTDKTSLYSLDIEVLGVNFLLGTCQSSSMKMENEVSFRVVYLKKLAYRDDMFLGPSSSTSSTDLGFLVGILCVLL